MKRRSFLGALPAAALAAPFVARAQAPPAPTRKETLLLVQEYGPNSMDMQGLGAAQPVNGVALNCYDRLVRFKRRPLADGTMSFDKEQLEPELATSWQEASDSTSCTFKLRDDARFHSSRPVTAKDVKWSLDRAVSIGGFASTRPSGRGGSRSCTPAISWRPRRPRPCSPAHATPTPRGCWPRPRRPSAASQICARFPATCPTSAATTCRPAATPPDASGAPRSARVR